MGQEFLEIEILNESIPKIAPKSNLQNIFVWVTHECVGMEEAGKRTLALTTYNSIC